MFRAVLLLSALALSGCIFVVTSEKQIFAKDDFDSIGPTEWAVLAALFDAEPEGRSSKVSDNGRVEIVETSFGTMNATTYKEGKLISRGGLKLISERTFVFFSEELSGSRAGEKFECEYGLARASDKVFVVASVGQCDGSFTNHFIVPNTDPNKRPYKLGELSDDETDLKKLSALAAVHQIGISATEKSVFVFGDIAPAAFKLLAADAFSAGLLD
ncbi:MAG: hypothetical protein AAGM84_06505 [Pseudomonadota bacterium]